MMKRNSVIIGFIFAVSAGLLLAFSPDVMSMVILAFMCILMILGFWFGIRRILYLNEGFINARKHIARAKEVQTEDIWLAIKQNNVLFKNDYLDEQFDRFKKEYDSTHKQGAVISPCGVEDFIHEEGLSLYSWQAPVSQISNTLTGLGIVGTFVGLLIGLGSVGFSSVTTAINSLQVLLSGIETAFYTSIAGVILSIVFNISYRIVWNTMLRELGLFYQSFHHHIVPSVEAQQLRQEAEFQSTVLNSLTRGNCSE